MHLDDQSVIHLVPAYLHVPFLNMGWTLQEESRCSKTCEAVVIDQARVDGEDAHEKDEVAPWKKVFQIWPQEDRRQQSVSFEPDPRDMFARRLPAPLDSVLRHGPPTQRGSVSRQAVSK